MATIKTYKGKKNDLFAFLTFTQIGYILAGHPEDFAACDRKVNAGVDWYEEGTEEEAQAAEAENRPFEPNGCCGVRTQTEPFDVEIVLGGSYGGVHDFEAKYRATRITYRIVWINGISQKRKTLNTKSIEYSSDTTLLEIQSLLAKLATSGRQMAEVYGHLA